MEQPPPTRRKKNSTRVSAAISLAVHLIVAFFVFFWAAREGVLGTKLQEITVALVPKEKPPPEPPPPPPPPKIEPPKEELPKEIEPPRIVTAPPPPQNDRVSSPVTAPAPAVLPDFAFSDGAKQVETGTNNVVGAYKNLLEYALRANWERPQDIIDDSFTADVELHVDPSGRITSYDFKKGSGNQLWDDSVRKAIDGTRSLDQPPPKGFPGKILIRFDVLPASSDMLSH